jgi:hypothetical protein
MNGVYPTDRIVDQNVDASAPTKSPPWIGFFLASRRIHTGARLLDPDPLDDFAPFAASSRQLDALHSGQRLGNSGRSAPSTRHDRHLVFMVELQPQQFRPRSSLAAAGTMPIGSDRRAAWATGWH